MNTCILPVFESFALSFTETASRPGSPDGGHKRSGENEVTDGGSIATGAGGSSRGGGGGGGGSQAPSGSDVADGDSLAGGSLASDPVPGSSGGNGGGALPTDLPPGGADSIGGGGGGEEVTGASLTLRVIELEVTELSEADVDAEAARSLLPEPLVPAPDPRVVPIPPEKLRQQVRRPVPRVQRPPLQTLEILPVLPLDASPPSSRPGSRNATSKASVGGAAAVKTEQQRRQQPTALENDNDNEKADTEGGERRAASGALEGNPYRWVVSEGYVACFFVLVCVVNGGNSGGRGRGGFYTSCSSLFLCYPDRFI